MKNKILFTLALLTTSIYLVFQYVYQDHRDLTAQEAKYQITSDMLFNHYTKNPDLANDLYLNQVIELKGILKARSEDIIILQPGVVCKLDRNSYQNNIKKTDSIKIKGRCIGFDDLFGEVKLDHTVIN